MTSAPDGEIGEKPECAERDRLLLELDQSLKNLIEVRESKEADTAWKAWREARKAYQRHIEQHGC